MPDETTPPVVSTPPPATLEPPPVAPRAEAQPEGKGSDQIAEEARQKMANMKGFWNRISPGKETEPKPGDQPAPPADAATEPDPKKETKKAKTETPAPASETPDPKPETKRRKREPEVDPAQIAETTGRAIGEQLARSLSATKPATPEPAPASEPELPEEFRRDTAVFEEMAKSDPKRYGNIKKDLAKYVAAENQYIAKWEVEHPGEEFDGDADEHNEFYRKVKPDFDQADFDAAKESLIEQRVANRTKEELRKEFEQRELEREKRREKTDQIRPEIDRDMVGLMGEMAKEADPTQTDLKDWKAIEALDEKNPLLADVMVTVHNETKPVLEASKRLFRHIDKPDENNPAHHRVFELISEAEQAVIRLPLKDRYDDHGRLFATQNEYAKMSEADRARHWYVGETELAELIRGRAKARTKAIYEHESKRLARYTNGASATPTPKPAERKDPEPPPPPKPDTASPSVSGRGSLPGDGQKAPATPSDGKGWFWSKFLSA